MNKAGFLFLPALIFKQEKFFSGCVYMNSTASVLRSFDSHSSLRFMTDAEPEPSLSLRRQKQSYIFISNAILGRRPCLQGSLQAPTHSSIGLCSTRWLLPQVDCVDK